MNSDKISHSPSITVVPLATTFLHRPLISHELSTLLTSLPESGEKVLLLYNRRGYGRAWICQDCGYFPLCPQCDIALSYHTYPFEQLVCHHCSYRMPLFLSCPHCASHGFRSIGIGIQEIEGSLEKLFPHLRLLRIDSDTSLKKSVFTKKIIENDIILSTYASLGAIQSPSITHVVVTLFESELTLPDYRMEEDLYHVIDYLKKSGKSIIIQTYLPDHPLLTLLLEGNYKNFLALMSEERKKFHYPPYSEHAIIRIHDEKKDKVTEIMSKITNKIDLLKTGDIFVSFDREITDKLRGEWLAKIILKGKNLRELLSHLEVEIVRNRSVTLEWR